MAQTGTVKKDPKLIVSKAELNQRFFYAQLEKGVAQLFIYELQCNIDGTAIGEMSGNNNSRQ